MALKLNTMDRRALIEKFHQMDKNCDGVLTPSEIRLCVQRSGLPPSKVDEFLRLFDLSGDNMITLQEYICALGLQPPPPKELLYICELCKVTEIIFIRNKCLTNFNW
ncbi:unnamed protein product [Schistosoma curassoni]|nr:unnamed protein product [Schistosoma curassoni]